MAQNMLVIGSTIDLMDSESRLGQMALAMKVALSLVKKMEQDPISGPTVQRLLVRFT